MRQFSLKQYHQFLSSVTLFFIVLLLNLISCSPESAAPPKYLRWVGDIAFDPATDDPDFIVCDAEHAKQYHNFSFGFLYKGEKITLEREIRAAYNAALAAKESGMIRIRFLVNCQGESGLFRIIGMDKNRKPFVFDKSITDQLMKITKGLKGWLILPEKEAPKDYYIYLIFKIENGVLKEILP